MSSLVIGLDIGGSHITATLVRIEQLSNRVLSIEKDKLYSLAYEQPIRRDPRLIISTWIDCIHELLRDLVDELKEDDTIIGIACGIPGPMDYERGISYIQSSTLHKCNNFFGLNLRLSFEYGLRELVSCWKHQSNVKCDTLSVSSSFSTRSYSKQQINPENLQQTTQIATISSVKSDTFNFTVAATTPNEEIKEEEFSIKDTKNYCGRSGDADFYMKYEINDSTHQINFDNMEVNSTEKSITIENSSAILLSIMEQLSDIPISFYNDATCFAVGEATSIQHKAYQRILALTLGTGFGSTFIDQYEIIKNRCDVPPGGMLWNYPYDDKSIADDWFSTRGLINIYNTILQQESLDNHSHMSINKEKPILNINNKSNTLDGVSLAAQASNGDENALKAFQIFAECLGNFLIPHIKKFKADLIVIGGGLAQTWHFIENELNKTIKKFCNTEVYFSLAHEKSICLGASFINDTSPLIYIDLPKNELYYRVAAETSCSYLKPTEIIQQESSSKSNDNDDYELTQDMYEKKCLYFLDYPVFNKLKQELLSRMTFFVDGQRPNCPTWLHGHTFRQALSHLANVPIRVRPWFESGPWGGEWLKSICTNLSQLSRNYAWSFEMITPENGIILSDENHHLLEFSWDLFYGSQANRILGNYEHYRLFGGSNDFPIRFDFLDTMDGGNLSIQCHPNLEYMRTNFGEKITQDETYYIVETKQHWKEEHNNDNKASAHVYLGFQDNVDPEEFHQALLSSRREQKELNVEKYIQSIPSNMHDFFLIPNETIHASGQNQVVLEISATPYIYTFKLYDWLRLGLDGHLRPLNIERGMKNLKFDRRGEQLRCQPITMKFEQEKYEEQYLPTHNLHFYDVERLIIQSDESIEIVRSTENRFHLCMLVEGDAIEIEFNTIDNDQQKQLRQYNYIETFLIPASITQYRLRPIIKNQNNKKKPRQFVLLIAFLKWNCEKLLD
ncbi:unnamed protein product [Rotaria socialis]|uniref:Uncharacterized protein n=1 Tax=Rotaria socialis TaxID=392032 RepID=A0A819VRH1_9BILA|nr:unnamed protein product [Rotaria socialis]